MSILNYPTTTLVSPNGFLLDQATSKEFVNKLRVNVELVDAYCRNLKTIDLKTVDGQVTPWLGKAKQQLTTAKSHANNWLIKISPSMINMPTSFNNYFHVIKPRYPKMNSLCTKETLSPSEIEELRGLFLDLQNGAKAQATSIDGTKNSVRTFIFQMESDHKHLRQTADQARKDVGDQEGLVAQLEDQIKILRKEIDTSSKNKALSGIVAGTSVFVGSIGVVLCATPLWPLGFVVIVGSVIGFTAGIAGIIATSVADNNSLKKISDLRTSIQKLNHNVSALTAVRTKIDELLLHKEDLTTSLLELNTSFTYISDQMGKIAGLVAKATVEERKKWAYDLGTSYGMLESLSKYIDKLTGLDRQHEPTPAHLLKLKEAA